MLCDAYFEGMQYQENLLTKYYIKRGFEVIIIASTFDSLIDYCTDKYNSKIKPSIEKYDSLTIYRLKFSINLFNRVRKLTSIYPILKEHKPDIIFVHDIHFNLHEAVLYKKRNLNCKIIMDYHADYSNSGKNWVSINILHKIIRKSYLTRFLRYIDKIYPIVPGSMRFLNEIYNIPVDKMELLPLGVDSDLINEIKTSGIGAKIRTDLNIPEHAVVIFTGGKLVPNKKTEILIEALKELAFDDLYLIVVGEVPSEFPLYRQQLNTLMESDKIKQVGWVKGHDVYNYMSACDIAVFPGTQTVLWQQSLGMGLALIISKYVTLPDGRIIDQEVEYLNRNNKILILDNESQKLIQIKNAILTLYRDTDLLSTFKKFGMDVGNNYLSYHNITKQTLIAIK